MQERQPPLTSRFRTLVELTLTLLKEIERLKDMQELQALGHQRRLSLKEELCRLEIEMIRRALIETGGHQSRAARLLGVKVTTLHEKIKRYGIDPDLAVENTDGGTSFEVSDDEEF
jgi:DNA-binding NtrC family response regulator